MGEPNRGSGSMAQRKNSGRKWLNNCNWLWEGANKVGWLESCTWFRNDFQEEECPVMDSLWRRCPTYVH